MNTYANMGRGWGRSEDPPGSVRRQLHLTHLRQCHRPL
jgi:hypothetical protein